MKSATVGLALPEPAGVKPLDLMPPEILQARKTARADRILVGVAALVVLAMIGGGVLRYLSVHKADNQVSSISANIATTKTQIQTYGVAEHKYTEVSADEGLLNPLVADEVNWPAVVNKVLVNTPSGGVVTSFSGTAIAATAAVVSTPGSPAPAAPPRSEVQIASVAVAVSATTGCLDPKAGKPNCAYAYFGSWSAQLGKSNALQLTTWSAFGLSTSGTVTYSATLGVVGTIQSSRLTRFEVLGK